MLFFWWVMILWFGDVVCVVDVDWWIVGMWFERMVVEFDLVCIGDVVVIMMADSGCNLF